MPLYNFKAKDPQGKYVKGIVESKTPKEAVALLHDRQLLVINLREKGSDVFKAISEKISWVTFGDLVNFTRQLATMFTAGLRLTEALQILAKQIEKPGLHKIILDLQKEVESGSSFAKALEKHSTFPKVYVAAVRAGEASGTLDKVLMRLADSLEKSKALKSKIVGSLIYPAFIFMAMMGAAFFLMIFVIPQMRGLFEAFGGEIPATTQLLFLISTALRNFWWLIILAMIGAVFLFRAWRKTPVGKKITDTLFLRVPVLGKIQKEGILAEFANTMGLLVSAGVPVVEGLNIVSGAMGNVLYQESVKEAAQKMEKGFPLSAILEASSLYPPILVQMTKVGEETGKIDETLTRVSNYFEAEADETVKRLTSLIEPIMIIVLALGVAFMAFSIILPIYKLVDQAGQL
ncbi:type II secretion system F family protein [Candidatus Microgenomates bacterium]|nr:type II secretion system F family protein [Candidatus Microgenomates bacterium]